MVAKQEVAAPSPPNETAFLSAFRAARRVSTPIVTVETPDPGSTERAIRGVLEPKAPVFAWDCTKGMRGLNDFGKAVVQQLSSDKKHPVDFAVTVNCTETLLICERLPELSVVFMYNLHLQLKEANGNSCAPVVQGLWNLRDLFKVDKRMIVGLGPMFQLPLEIQGDVISLDEPLPTRAELSEVVDQQHKNAGMPLPDDDTREAALDAIVGLAIYTAEQVTAMSLEKRPDPKKPGEFIKGLNTSKLWDRKIKAIQNTDGLRVWRPKPGETTLAELKGIDNVVAFVEELIAADAFGAIAFIDEGDKALAGGMSEYTGDSGVAKDQVGQVLSFIEDTGSLGVMLAGVAGCGKTQIAKATGSRSGKPVIVFDLGGMKGGVVGLSEMRTRTALKVLSATAEGRVLFLMTANKTTLFSPEMNRRFPDQFFFDVPDDIGRAAIWPVYIAKNGLTASQAHIPEGFDSGWTGAEIKRACERAALFGKTVVEAARYIIPSSVSHADAINQLRLEADGRFLSASYHGYYQVQPDVPGGGKRSIDVQ